MAYISKKNSGRIDDESSRVSAKAGVELKLTSGTSMYINTGNSQNQGARPYQEDSFGYSNIIDSEIISNKGMVAILSDGMGGLANGKVVADYVVQTAIAMFESMNPMASISDQLQKVVQYINDSVCEQYVVGGSSKAGATVVIAYIYKNRIYWITVGDSRLYCYRNGHLLQMNEDHDYKNQLFREYINNGGNIREAEEDGQKDSLVCFIGKSEIPYVDVSLKGYMIRPNDTFVLCSDGIYNGISQDSMTDILSAYDAQSASDKIVESVVGARFPGQDNMTVMVIKCEKN